MTSAAKCIQQLSSNFKGFFNRMFFSFLCVIMQNNRTKTYILDAESKVEACSGIASRGIISGVSNADFRVMGSVFPGWRSVSFLPIHVSPKGCPPCMAGQGRTLRDPTRAGPCCTLLA